MFFPWVQSWSLKRIIIFWIMGQKRSGSLLILTLNQEGHYCTLDRKLLRFVCSLTIAGFLSHWLWKAVVCSLITSLRKFLLYFFGGNNILKKNTWGFGKEPSTKCQAIISQKPRLPSPQLVKHLALLAKLLPGLKKLWKAILFLSAGWGSLYLGSSSLFSSIIYSIVIYCFRGHSNRHSFKSEFWCFLWLF